MTFRKKLAASTIAASVALTVFSGIPLSNKGLAEKLGVSGVTYAATYSDFIAEANKIYAELKKNEAGLAAVNALRTQIDNALATDVSLSELTNKIANGNDSIQADVEELIGDLLFVQITDNWQAQYEEYQFKYLGLLENIGEEHGIAGELSLNDLASVFLTLELNLASILVDIDLSQIASLKGQLKAVATSTLNSNANVKALVDSAGITSDDLASLYVQLQNSSEVNPITVIQAYAALNTAYKAAYPVTVTPPVTPPVGGGGGFPSDIYEIPQDVKALQKQLEELKGKLATATDEEKAALIAEALKNVQTQINKLSVIENTVKVTDGVAVLELSENKTRSAIAGIAAAIKSLEDATGIKLPAPQITIDLGTVKESEVSLGLVESIIKEAIEAKLGAINLKVNGLTVSLPVAGMTPKALELNVKTSDADSSVVGNLPVASSVYDFSLLVGGTPVTSFDNPIAVHVPVSQVAGLDTELLSLAKIVNGKLVFVGGHYRDGVLVENREGFSSYVVVENKVSFNDIASVKSWAGRAIEVVAAKSAINGKAEGRFAPADSVTRAEFAKMLVRALDLDSNSAEEKFEDVLYTDWFAPYVASAVQLGIINGRSATKFDPHATITRAEMATMITRAVKASKGSVDAIDVDTALKGFADAGLINETLKEGVAFAAANKIVQGYNGKFNPNGKATRAQAAVIIHNAIKNVNQ